jgi:hypothetical protein
MLLTIINKKMKLSDLKKDLSVLNTLTFIQPNGSIVPLHFHITEAGLTTKHFIDCGGTVRTENVVNFQLWEANDFDHRLSAKKLLNIIELSEKALSLQDFDVEVEYQTNTIGRYGLNFDGTNFILTNKKTDCLAKENCGTPKEKQKINLSELQKKESSCCGSSESCCN